MKLKQTPKKEYYYHISIKNFKSIKTFIPQKYGENRCDTEPHIARTCVCNRIYRCLLAVPFFKTDRFYVYKTLVPAYAYYPYDVIDSKSTREKWLVTPIKFRKIGWFNITKDFPEEAPCFAYHSQGTKEYSICAKLIKENLHVHYY